MTDLEAHLFVLLKEVVQPGAHLIKQAGQVGQYSEPALCNKKRNCAH